MRKQDQLIALIHSLSQGEKKYFVQRSKSANQSKSYVKLYELLLKKDSYDTAEICRVLKKSKPDLANEKKYLQKNLLQALCEYHREHHQISVLNRISEAVLLTERNLPQMATAALKQAIKTATETELPPLAWHAHGLMLTLYSDPFVSFTESEKQANLHLLGMEEMAGQINHTTGFEMLNQQVFAAYNQRRLDTTAAHKKETEKLLNHPLLNANYNSFQLQSYKYSLLSLLYARMGNAQANIQVNRNLLELYEKQPKIDAAGYWNTIANLTQATISKGHATEYKEWMDKLNTRYYRKLPVDHAYITDMLAKHKSIFDSGAYFRFLYTANPPKTAIAEFVKRILQTYQHERKKVHRQHFLSIIYKTAACSLAINQPDSCIQLLSRLLNETDENDNVATVKNARIVFMIAHAQAGNYLLLPSLQQSFVKHLRKTKLNLPAELIFIRQLNGLATATGKRQKLKWFQDLNKQLTGPFATADLEKLIQQIPLKQWVECNL